MIRYSSRQIKYSLAVTAINGMICKPNRWPNALSPSNGLCRAWNGQVPNHVTDMWTRALTAGCYPDRSHREHHGNKRTTNWFHPFQLTQPLTALSTFSIVAVTRRDSDLEAFSPNPTDGSFAPLFDRTSAWTKCPNLRFLSYWAGLLSQRLCRVISRVKLTCLTTV